MPSYQLPTGYRLLGADLIFTKLRSYLSPQRNLEILREFFHELISLPFDGHAAEIAGRIRAQLASLGTPIGGYDLQIAAIALANNLILVTHNSREFNRVPDLQTEDWEIE